MKLTTLSSLSRNLALTSSILITAACGSAPKPEAAPKPAKSRAAIHVFESDANGFNTKNFFYDNGEEVVVFDTQFTPELAEQSIAFLRTKTRSPITTVVITHPNPDKFNGMSAFQKQGAKVIASARTADAMKGVHEYKQYFFVNLAKMFTDETYPRLSAVDLTFSGSHDLRLRNGEVITLRELSQPGVSSTQTVALIPGQKAVIVGDMVHHRAHAWLEGGIVGGKATPTLKGWIAGLREIGDLAKEIPGARIFGGRGEVAPAAVAVRQQINYLRQADAIVAKYVKSLGERRAELTGEKAGAHHQAIEARMEKAFPGYGLGYMIQYGVYGLAQAKM